MCTATRKLTNSSSLQPQYEFMDKLRSCLCVTMRTGQERSRTRQRRASPIHSIAPRQESNCFTGTSCAVRLAVLTGGLWACATRYPDPAPTVSASLLLSCACFPALQTDLSTSLVERPHCTLSCLHRAPCWSSK